MPDKNASQSPGLITRTKIMVLFVLLFVVAGGVYASVQLEQPADSLEADSVSYQTATARIGDILVSVSGSGTLVAAEEVGLQFSAGGEILEIDAAVGDHVEAGQLLAVVDDSQVQISLIQAQRTYNELYSPSAILEAEYAIYAAQLERDSAYETLAHMVSRSVLIWEANVEEAEAALEAARAGGDAEAIAEAEFDLTYAQRTLKSARNDYLLDYVPDTFTSDVCTGEGRSRSCVKTVCPPSDEQIQTARTTYELAEIAVQQAETYYQALTTGEIAEGIPSSQLASLENAARSLDDALADVEGTRIYAPFDGTILEVNGQVGLEASGDVFTIADLDQLYMEIYVDETDWDLVDAGYLVEVIFDSYPDEVFSGTITYVDPSLVTEDFVSVVLAYVQLEPTTEQQAYSLVLGANATVEVIAGQAEDVVTIPLEALQSQLDDTTYRVYLLDAEGNPEARTVEVGLLGVTYAEIVSGLQVGEQVIIEPIDLE